MAALLKADDIYAEQNDTDDAFQRSSDPYSVVFVAQTPAVQGEWVPSEKIGDVKEKGEGGISFIFSHSDC